MRFLVEGNAYLYLEADQSALNINVYLTLPSRIVEYRTLLPISFEEELKVGWELEVDAADEEEAAEVATDLIAQKERWAVEGDLEGLRVADVEVEVGTVTPVG